MQIIKYIYRKKNIIYTYPTIIIINHTIIDCNTPGANCYNHIIKIYNIIYITNYF